jgi:hypothetical protein
VVHVVGLVAVVAAVGVATFALLRALGALFARSQTTVATPSRWLDDMLVLGFWGGVASFIVAVVDANDPANMRYLVPPVIFGAVLAGRYLARANLSLSRRAVVAAAVPAAALVAVYVLATLVPLHDPIPPGPHVLSTWLEAHGLERGIAPYWDASVVTLDTRQRVTVRAVLSHDGRLRPYHFYASLDWFKHGRAGGTPTFLVYEPAQPWGGVDAQSATRTFGPPVSTTQVDRYEVLVWNRDIFGDLGSPVTQ